MKNRQMQIDTFLQYQQKLKKCRQNTTFFVGSAGEDMVMSYLAHTENKSASPNELAKANHVSSARIASILNKLEKKLLITRAIDPADRRRIVVEMTKRGIKLADNVEIIIKRDVGRVFDYLGDEDTAQYLRILEKVIEHFEKEAKEDGRASVYKTSQRG